MSEGRRSRVVYGRDGKKRFFINDVEVSEAAHEAAFPSKIRNLLRGTTSPGGHGTTTWPMNAGLSLGVHAKQVGEAQARADRHGINVRYQRNGDVIVPDKGNYAKLLKLEGLHNKAEGFHGA
jgi:hypothetical protein